MEALCSSSCKISSVGTPFFAMKVMPKFWTPYYIHVMMDRVSVNIFVDGDAQEVASSFP